MKPIFSVLLILTCGAGLALGDPPHLPPHLLSGAITDVGRFQLVAAAVNTTASGIEEHALFRIDTATGQVWRYQELPVAVTVLGDPDIRKIAVDGWIAIGEDLQQQIINTEKQYPKK
jgi:hypothetical protein